MQDQIRNQPAQPGERWVSVEEIIAHLGVSRDTVYRLIDHTRQAAHRVGKPWKFKVPEVDDWVRSSHAHESRIGSRPAGKTRRSLT